MVTIVSVTVEGVVMTERFVTATAARKKAVTHPLPHFTDRFTATDDRKEHPRFS